MVGLRVSQFFALMLIIALFFLHNKFLALTEVLGRCVQCDSRESTHSRAIKDLVIAPFLILSLFKGW